MVFKVFIWNRYTKAKLRMCKQNGKNDVSSTWLFQQLGSTSQDLTAVRLRNAFRPRFIRLACDKGVLSDNETAAVHKGGASPPQKLPSTSTGAMMAWQVSV